MVYLSMPILRILEKAVFSHRKTPENIADILKSYIFTDSTIVFSKIIWICIYPKIFKNFKNHKNPCFLRLFSLKKLVTSNKKRTLTFDLS